MSEHGHPAPVNATLSPAIPTPQAPPTHPQALGPRPNSWPSVVGIISVILGILGLLSSLWSILGTVLFHWFSGVFEKFAVFLNTPQNQFADTAQVMRAWAIPLLAGYALNAIVAIALIIGGAMLYQRRRASLRVLNFWAAGKIIASIATLVVGVFVQIEQMRHMNQASGPGVPAALTTTIAVLTSIIGLLWLCAYPVFMLIWLNLKARRAEIARWRA